MATCKFLISSAVIDSTFSLCFQDPWRLGGPRQAS
jgi:hypothetical protein